jgi:4-hydroxy-2-oxoheptanedioate aldolase
MKMLDAGAYGIICPMINTVEDARRLVAACRYAPAGNRSYGPIRALLYAGQDYPEHANATVLPIAMIETAEAMANLEAILAVEGLGGIYVGPSDLALSLGHPPRFDVEEGPVRDAIGRILDGARSAGVPAGIHTGSAAYALKMIAAGFRFVTIGSDARLMAAGAQAALKAMRADAAPPAPRPGAY